MVELDLRPESALNLTLAGSLGSFQAGTGRGDQQSLEVRYFLTHVGLNFASGTNEQLLGALAPVREVFDFKSLDFDQIMQRDIDDARVSAELVPYLLDERSRDMIKLFPPIVIVVLPTEENRNRPADYYPAISIEEKPPQVEGGYGQRITRSGRIGFEAFAFEQPIVDGQPLLHDRVRLRLNMQRTRLVIVDGQHRAMALLAIYRNLKDGWSDERCAPYKEYYAAWTPSYISKFNLKEINLPVILCVVPALDENYTGSITLKEAARSIFLTLNKNARKVSESRNKLLDDGDLIALFMRRTLSHIKQADQSPHAFRIWNVELDQFGDKMKIQSPIALTGVNHIYYMIEHILLNDEDVSGVAPRSGKFYKRKDLHNYNLLDRLDGRNILGNAVSLNLRRDNFSAAAAEKLGIAFDNCYGGLIVAMFAQFSPFDRHARAVMDLEAILDKHQDRQLRPILFDGQGIGRVFEAHRITLKDRLDQKLFSTDVAKVEASLRQLDATAERIRRTVNDFRSDRASRYFADLTDKRLARDSEGTLDVRAVTWCNNLFDNVLLTVAFQSALVCGFFGEIETAQRRSKTTDYADAPPLERERAFDEFVTQLNSFFVPRTPTSLKRLLRVFSGEVIDDGDIWQARPSNQTFRSIVYRGEMQPDQWPRYRYLLLEIWKPTHPALADSVEAECAKCRKEVFAALEESYSTAYCRDTKKLRGELSKQETDAIFEQAFGPYSALVKNLGASPLDRNAMKLAASTVPATAAAQSEDDPETWESTAADADS